MVYGLCMDTNRTLKLSSKPQSRLSEYKKKHGSRRANDSVKERTRRIVETYVLYC